MKADCENFENFRMTKTQRQQLRKHKQRNQHEDHRSDHLEVHQMQIRGQIQGQILDRTLVATKIETIKTDMNNIIMNLDTMKVSLTLLIILSVTA